MATAHQLYPDSRTEDMTAAQLLSVQRFALADSAETAHTTVYAGMDRADTVATARRTVQDVQTAMNRLAAARHADGCRCATLAEHIEDRAERYANSR